MIRAHFPEPCWEIHDVDTGQPPEAEYGDGWAHYRTRAEAAEQIARMVAAECRHAQRRNFYREKRLLIAALSFPTPCVGLFCDGPDCPASDEPFDAGWTHLDPGDPTPFDIDPWEEIGGKHFCEECAPPWCDDCDGRHASSDCPSLGEGDSFERVCAGQMTIEECL